MATGLSRATIANRAYRLGFERTGKGYTAMQVLAIIAQPKVTRRGSEEAALELRDKLKRMMEEAGLPIEFIKKNDGSVRMVYQRVLPQPQHTQVVTRQRHRRVERYKTEAGTP